ncbi:MAG: hypothetical protein JW731_15765 [Bacteroidales bacterium]|nr:hypothetical protein [Bacteroidales bacterium]
MDTFAIMKFLKSIPVSIVQFTIVLSPLFAPFHSWAQNNNFDELLKTDMDLPISFDLRNTDRLGEIKSQPAGGCWASATMGTVESFWKTAGFSEVSLSDKNLKEFHGFVPERNSNGNHNMATAYFARRSGPLEAGTAADSISENNPVTLAYITDARYLPDDPGVVKKVIMHFGSVYSMMYHRKQNLDTISDIYYTKKEQINHAVALVGWNDTLRTRNGAGVWIAQNSLGLNYGDKGFFLIPYSDPNILKYNAVWPRWIPYDPKSQILYYDTLGSYQSYGFGDSVCYGLIKFTAGQNAVLSKVGTFVNHPETKITFTVFDDFDNNTKILSDLLFESKTFKCSLAGYYTFDLDEKIKISQSDDFFIMMKYSNFSDTIPMPVEKYIKGYSNPGITSGKCWTNPDFEKWPSTWYECGTNSTYQSLIFDLCIKAYMIEE